MEISQEVPQPSINKIISKSTYLNFHSDIPRASEWNIMPNAFLWLIPRADAETIHHNTCLRSSQVNIISDDGKPLPEPMFASIYSAIYESRNLLKYRCCCISWCVTTINWPLITVTLGVLLPLKSPVTWLFIQQLVHANHKSNDYYWPFVCGIHLSLVDSPCKEPVMWKAFPCHNSLMI